MLTGKALEEERKWGHLPALRKLFANLPVPNTRDNPMLSISDSEAERLSRTSEIALTVLKNAAILTARPTKEETALVAQDLERL